MECLATGTGGEHNRLRSLSADGEEQGVFERIWQAGLQEYDELEGIAWEWQSMDGVMRHPPRIAWSRDRRQSYRSRQTGNETQSIE
jgi:hypothetical protein